MLEADLDVSASADHDRASACIADALVDELQCPLAVAQHAATEILGRLAGLEPALVVWSARTAAQSQK